MMVNLLAQWNNEHRHKNKHILIQRPKVIEAYNEHMGGADLINMLISLH